MQSPMGSAKFVLLKARSSVTDEIVSEFLIHTVERRIKKEIPNFSFSYSELLLQRHHEYERNAVYRVEMMNEIWMKITFIVRVLTQGKRKKLVKFVVQSGEAPIYCYRCAHSQTEATNALFNSRLNLEDVKPLEEQLNAVLNEFIEVAIPYLKRWIEVADNHVAVIVACLAYNMANIHSQLLTAMQGIAKLYGGKTQEATLYREIKCFLHNTTNQQVAIKFVGTLKVNILKARRDVAAVEVLPSIELLLGAQDISPSQVKLNIRLKIFDHSFLYTTTPYYEDDIFTLEFPYSRLADFVDKLRGEYATWVVNKVIENLPRCLGEAREAYTQLMSKHTNPERAIKPESAAEFLGTALIFAAHRFVNNFGYTSAWSSALYLTNVEREIQAVSPYKFIFILTALLEDGILFMRTPQVTLRCSIVCEKQDKLWKITQVLLEAQVDEHELPTKLLEHNDVERISTLKELQALLTRLVSKMNDNVRAKQELYTMFINKREQEKERNRKMQNE